MSGLHWLDIEEGFPDPREASLDGLLAVGGDLAPERLLSAYRAGIFPWPWDQDAPLLWWSPDPRFVLYPAELRVSRSLQQRIRSGRFEVTLDRAFDDVVRSCARVRRRDEPGTWITPAMVEAYGRLHADGQAHSVEAWWQGELVGGLYGVVLGRAFFGESMFHTMTDASKVAFVHLVRQLEAWGVQLVDCQLHTGHLARLGGRSISRNRFLDELTAAFAAPSPTRWVFDPELTRELVKSRGAVGS